MNAKANNTNKAQELCEKLYLAAKKSKTRRFHALYDKVYRTDILTDAWNSVKANKGAAGIDNETIKDVQKDEEAILTEIQRTLEEGKYHPKRVKQVDIPKSDGKRSLGIPTVRDRIVQTAAKRLIKPIFEADFLDCNYGFRPNKCAHEALEEIRKTMNAGYVIVLDADIKQFFDNIDHDKLLELVHKRISDRRILKLIRKWLKHGILNESKGTPQGGVISPLLANIYLHEFDKYWIQQTEVEGKLIRYADDFVILFKTEEEAQLGLQLVKTKLKELGLELNEHKTKTVDTREGKEGFDFLGFHHRRRKSKKYNRYYTYKWPSAKSMRKIKTKIRDCLGRRSILNRSTEEIVKELNPILRGWMNYYRFGNSSKKFSQIDSYVHEKLALWWNKKHQKTGRGWKTNFTYSKYKDSGVQRLSGNTVYWSYYSNAQDEGHRKAV